MLGVQHCPWLTPFVSFYDRPVLTLAQDCVGKISVDETKVSRGVVATVAEVGSI